MPEVSCTRPISLKDLAALCLPFFGLFAGSSKLLLLPNEAASTIVCSRFGFRTQRPPGGTHPSAKGATASAASSQSAITERPER